MKKIIFFLIACSAFSLKLFSQTITTKWVTPDIPKGKPILYRTLGVSGNELFVAYADRASDLTYTTFNELLYKPDFCIDIFNLNTFKKTKTINLSLNEKNKKSIKTDILGIRLINNKIAVLYIETDKKNNKRTLLMDYVDLSTNEWEGQDKILFEETKSKISFNKSKILIFDMEYDKSLLILCVNSKKERYPAATILRVDQTGNVANTIDDIEFVGYNPSSKYAFHNLEFKHVDIYSNRLYLHTYLKNIRNNYNQHENYLTEINFENNQARYYTLSSEKKMSTEIISKHDSTKNMLYFVSTYSDKTSKEINGISIFSINTQTGNTKETDYLPFKVGDCNFMNDKKNDITFLENIHVREVVIKNNGNLLLILEFLVEQGIAGPDDTKGDKTERRNFKDIILFEISDQSKIQSVQKVSRNNTVFGNHTLHKWKNKSDNVIEGSGNEKSFYTFIKGEELLILYYDIPANTKTPVSKEGLVNSKIIESSSNDEKKLIPVIAIYNMSTSSFVGKKNQNKQAWKNFFNNPDQIIPYENDLIILNMNHSYELIGKMTISD